VLGSGIAGGGIVALRPELGLRTQRVVEVAVPLAVIVTVIVPDGSGFGVTAVMVGSAVRSGGRSCGTLCSLPS
jgi:hypothetical protein